MKNIVKLERGCTMAKPVDACFETRSPTIESLPNELLTHIIRLLSFDDVVCAGAVCGRWRQVAQHTLHLYGCQDGPSQSRERHSIVLGAHRKWNRLYVEKYLATKTHTLTFQVRILVS